MDLSMNRKKMNFGHYKIGLAYEIFPKKKIVDLCIQQRKYTA